MNYIYSTLTADTGYAVYVQSADLPIVEKVIYIKGGANVANKDVYTPLGVRTEVSDEDLAILKKDYHFNEHIKNGFLSIADGEKISIEKAVKSMKDKDRSAPVTPDDDCFKQETGAKPKGMRKK